MGGRAERPQKTDSQAVDAFGKQFGERFAHIIRIDWRDHFARYRHPLADSPRQIPGNQRFGRCRVEKIHRLSVRQSADTADRPARDHHGVFKTARG